MADKSAINRTTLLNALNLVRPALAAQPYIPALTHVRFASDGWLTAYNDVSAILIKSGFDLDRCIPGDMLIKTLSGFSGDQVMLQQAAGGAMVISSGRAKVKMPTLDAADFPFELPELDEAYEIDVDKTMLAGITRCLFAVGNDNAHPAQMGITLDASDDGTAILFSTDNYTISRYETKWKIELPADAPIIMPTFFCEQMQVLAKAFPDQELVLLVLPGALVLEIGKVAKLMTKTLVDLEPMDFPTMISKHCNLSKLTGASFTIPDAFEAALGRALLVIGGEVEKTTKVSVDEDLLKLHSACAMGESDDTLALKGADPKDAFYVDPSLLLRGAKASTSIAFLDRAVAMLNAPHFLHLIAHCATPEKA